MALRRPHKRTKIVRRAVPTCANERSVLSWGQAGATIPSPHLWIPAFAGMTSGLVGFRGLVEAGHMHFGTNRLMPLVPAH